MILVTFYQQNKKIRDNFTESDSYDSKDVLFTGGQPMTSFINLSEDVVTQLMHKASSK